jgi:hypothetical protein
VWLVGILAIYQGLIWTIVHFFAETERAGGLQGLLPYGITLFLIAFIGGILGLMVSALSGTAMTTSSTSWVLLLTIPQFLLLLGPINYWPQLAMMSLFLILVLIGIKHRAGAVRT